MMQSVVSCLLIAAAAETLLWIRVIVSMLAMEATPLPSSESCECERGMKMSQMYRKSKSASPSKWRNHQKKAFQQHLASTSRKTQGCCNRAWSKRTCLNVFKRFLKILSYELCWHWKSCKMNYNSNQLLWAVCTVNNSIAECAVSWHCAQIVVDDLTASEGSWKQNEVKDILSQKT